MKVVYATSTFAWSSWMVRQGSHWPADDPVVLANPGSFSDDPRIGLSYSVEPPEEELAVAREKRSYVRRN